MRARRQVRWESGICPLAVGRPQQFSSFVTKRVKDVEARVGNDLAFLRGLYKMSRDKSLLFQQSEIANQMKETLGR